MGIELKYLLFIRTMEERINSSSIESFKDLNNSYQGTGYYDNSSLHRIIHQRTSELHHSPLAKPKRGILRWNSSYLPRNDSHSRYGLLDESSITPHSAEEILERKDRLGNSIKSGSKSHHITFSMNLLEVREVESYKQYNTNQEEGYMQRCYYCSLI
eukprot:TRINITY_DN853_c0_g1_i1.p1 TRINITY_DN853_c0_g1~~TRINITY_DN853_c0_g1_i1.p1  ORF type:complete len:157 (+),score=13.57 TRINITY_DN853_c0_g1_i1:99-569(+)